MAIAQRKSHLRAGSSGCKKKIILIIVVIAALIVSLAIVISKINIDLSQFKDIFAKIEVKSISTAQIVVLIAGGIATFCFAKYKNIILLITAIFYSMICFITFGGINIMNSYWFWVLICIAELIAIITTYISTGDSFSLVVKAYCFNCSYWSRFGLLCIACAVLRPSKAILNLKIYFILYCNLQHLR